MVLFFSPVDSHWRECVAAAKKFGKKRTRVFEDDVSIENTRFEGGSKTQDLNLLADMSSGPGQWFPETEYVSVRHVCGNKWHTAQNNLKECKVL